MDDLVDFPQLQFRTHWGFSYETSLNLGQCVAIIECLGDLPIDPGFQRDLKKVAFSRGAQASTAIEGNTLTDEELQQLLDGVELPKSREYQAQEVNNALEAMNFVWKQIVKDGERPLVTPKLLCDLNRIVGKNLGKLYDGVPGRLRQDRRHVGRYLAPPPQQVPVLLDRLCEWLRKEFQFESGRQKMDEAILQAIVAHIYFEWVHPFADGNGRTGRLLEFFILLRGGLPDIAAHVLANHYNRTRPEYAANFEIARKKRDLSEFIAYSVQGLLDGLRETLKQVQQEAFRTAWRSHIYDVFAAYSNYRKTSVFKRRRQLALAMPLGRFFTPNDLLRESDALMSEYLRKDERTLAGDLKKLFELKLIEKKGRLYRAATGQLSNHIASRAKATHSLFHPPHSTSPVPQTTRRK